jgi:hypothetical protein
MLAILVVVALAQTVASALAPVPDVRQISASAPKAVAEIDTAKVRGTPVGLAWNADGTIYLRVVEGKDKFRHYQIATAPALSVGQSDQTPEWAAAYWNWKSAAVAPGDPTLKLDVEQRVQRGSAVGGNSGGELAGSSAGALTSGGGEGMSQGTAINAANNQTTTNVVTFRFKGLVIGEWANEYPQPGIRMGWAPAPLGLLAYVDPEGRLNIADREGRHAPIAGATSAILPAWSLDGKRLVFLKKTSATMYVLMMSTIG